MANPKHLKILSKGGPVWNKWREKNPEILPDLSDIDLSQVTFIVSTYHKFHTTLPKKNSSEFLPNNSINIKNKLKKIFSNIFGSRIKKLYVDIESNPRNTKLISKSVIGVNFKETNLSRSNLSEANLSGVNLIKANLTGTNLVKANLEEADLREADLKDTILCETIFVATSLTNAKNLDLCIHQGPSIIDFNTIINSKNLPIEFLRGCGLPEKLINSLPKILNRDSFIFFSCFISYSSKNEKFAQRLHADLQDSGVRCWFAPENMKIGDKIRFALDDAIKIHDKLLLVLSEHSINSQWVEHEVEKAFEQERRENRLVLVPIRLDDAIFSSESGWASYLKNTRYIGDFTRWEDDDAYKRSLGRLLRDLKMET